MGQGRPCDNGMNLGGLELAFSLLVASNDNK